MLLLFLNTIYPQKEVLYPSTLARCVDNELHVLQHSVADNAYERSKAMERPERGHGKLKQTRTSKRPNVMILKANAIIIILS